MGREIRAFILLMAATFQAALYIGLAFYLAPILEKRWKMAFSWEAILLVLAFLAIFHVYYMVIRYTNSFK